MNLDLRQQRVFDQVELVRGVGTPGSGEMCVMSFVACLAGEPHTDHPNCASPLIRAFAIPLNDHMPQQARQGLKAFAPRVIGTNDGLDAARAALLSRCLAEEILPAIAERNASGAAGLTQNRPFRQLWFNLRRARLERRICKLMDQAMVGGEQLPGFGIQLAGTAARLIGLGGRAAADEREAQWYWGRGLEILDRLCEFGMPARQRLEIRPDSLELLEQSLAKRKRARGADDSLPGEGLLRAMLTFPPKGGDPG